MYQQGKYNDQGRRDFSDQVAELLDEWLLEVRHYPVEGDKVLEVRDILRSYGNKTS